MAFTLVHANTVIGSTVNVTTITPTCTSTTQHNLLVLAIGYNAANPGTVALSGWTQLVTVSGASSSTAQIWYLADCPAAITSVTITNSTPSNVGAQILEFAGGAATTPADRTGTATGTGTTLSVATSLTTQAANELAVSTSSWTWGGGATKVTMAAGTGFTKAGQFGDGLKQLQHFIADYALDTGASGSTPTDLVADGAITGSTGNAGVIATFKLPAAAATVPPEVAMSPMTGA